MFSDLNLSRVDSLPTRI